MSENWLSSIKVVLTEWELMETEAICCKTLEYLSLNILSH